MKKFILTSLVAIFLLFCGTSFAADVTPVPITAIQAFDAVQTQIDPDSGKSATVHLIDVRTLEEHYWVGAACQVDTITTTEGETIVPDYGKVISALSGRYIYYKLNGRHRILPVQAIASMALSPIAINIPFLNWDPENENGPLVPNPEFADKVNALASDNEKEKVVLIFFCRSGGRSQACVEGIAYDQFYAIYEIDQPDGQSGRGGFEGTSYSNVYNGYRGYPQRWTRSQDHPSVAWKDAGLPMLTGKLIGTLPPME